MRSFTSKLSSFLLTTASLSWYVEAFTATVPLSRDVVSSPSTTSLNALGVLARKAKEMQVKKYIDDGEMSSEVEALLKSLDNDNAAAASATPGPLQQSLTKRAGTISVIAEYKRRLDKGAFVDEVYEPNILSTNFREFGADAVAVLADDRMGGCDYDDVASVRDEQETARGDVPGPLPLVSSDLIVHEVQLARSAAAGCAGVVLRTDALAADRLVELVGTAVRLGLEPVVGVDDAEGARTAVEAGASILMINVGGDSVVVEGEEVVTAKDRIGILDSVEAPDGRAICKIANIVPYDDKGLQEVEDAWVCRDAGFQAVWASDVLYKSGNDAAEHPGAIIRSMKSKSSVKWASVKARGGKGEGAREYLGDILM